MVPGDRGGTDGPAHLARVVVEQRDRDEVALRRTVDLAQQRPGGVPGADDQDARRVARWRRLKANRRDWNRRPP
jgi:hypothetical protein